MKCLLLDIGSTFIKYSFYETKRGKNSKIFALPFPKPIFFDGMHFEVAREEIDRQILPILDKAAEAECKRVFLCVQMHGYFIRTGNTFSNYVSWRDNRGNVSDPRLSGIDFKENGTLLKRNLPVASLCTTDVASGSEFYTFGSYFAWRLTGKNITHKTDACATGFFDRKTLKQNVFLFDNLILPEVCNEVRRIGDYKGISIYTPTGDHQTSFLGAGADREDSLLINVGTATQITGVAPIDSDVNGAELRPYFDRNQCLITVTGIKSDEMFNFCSKVIGGIRLFGSRRKIFFGGGGAENAMRLLRDSLEKEGYSLMKLDKNVGNEGLKMIAESVEVKRGTMLSEIAFPNFPIIMKRQGLDFIIVDNEHGSFENKVIFDIAQNARFVELTTIVRLPDNSRQMITKLADGGVSAFLLPMTNTAEDIRQVVKYAKYTPVGARGISTTRAHTMYGVDDLKAYMVDANKKMKIYAQIETLQGVQNIEEILNTEGVEGVWIGPNDLSADIGCIGDVEPVKPYIAKICAAALQVGKPCGIITNNRELIRFALENGVDMISYGSEINMLKDGAKKIGEIF